jgi:membrane-bound ClpP family serine protease
MDSHAPTAGHSGAPSSISIPFVVLAAILIGAGLLLLFTWLVTFSWLWFVGVLPVTLGTLMLFDRRAGADVATPA